MASKGIALPVFGVALFCAAAIGPLAAQQPDPATPASASAELQALVDEATRLTLEGDKDADGRALVIESWRLVGDKAREAPLPDGGTNPLVHLARIKIASQLYAGGENAAARAELAPGLEGIEPYLADNLATYGEGMALLGVLMAQAGDAEGAMPIVRAGYDLFAASYAARDPAERGTGLAMARSNLEFSLSQVALRIGDTPAALEFQRASLDTREAVLGPDDPDTIASYYGYAGTLRRAGRMAEAEEFARIAVERAVAGVDESHPSYARSLEMLGIVLSRSGRPVEATGYLLKALQLKREHEGADNLVFGYGIHNLATIFLQRERYADASPLFIEAEALFRAKQGEQSPFAMGSLAYTGQIDFVEGRYEDAIRRLGPLDERLGSETSDVEIETRIAPDLIAALIEVGDLDAARRRADALQATLAGTDGSTAFELRRAELLGAVIDAARSDADMAAARAQAGAMLAFLRREGSGDAGPFLQSEHRAALDLVLNLAVRAQDAELMVSAMALLSESAIAQASALREQRQIEDDPLFAEALRRLQEADAALDAADRAFLIALAANADVDAKRRELNRAGARRADAVAALARDFPDWKERTSRLDGSLGKLQQSLAPDEGLVAVVPAYNGAYLLAATQTQVVVERLALDRAELLEQARRLRSSVTAGSFDRSAATLLGQAIFPRSVRNMLEDKTAIRVLAGGPLSSLPFSLLSWGEGDEAYLIDRFAIANIAGLSVPGTPGDAAARESRRELGRFVAFADPVFGRTGRAEPAILRGGQAGIADYFGREGPDFGQLSQLAPLPETAAEAASIASLFREDSATLFLGAAAAEPAVDGERVANADVLLFATHGLIAGEAEGLAEPALVLSLDPTGPAGADGLLTASEIERLNLKADWVILSACDSAAGMESGLPAFSGLARAFRFAGARDLLVTHWQVRDDVAAFISRETLRDYRQSGSKAAALRSAILKLRRDSDLPGRDRPEIWAPFALIEG